MWCGSKWEGGGKSNSSYINRSIVSRPWEIMVVLYAALVTCSAADSENHSLRTITGTQCQTWWGAWKPINKSYRSWICLALRRALFKYFKGYHIDDGATLFSVASKAGPKPTCSSDKKNLRLNIRKNFQMVWAVWQWDKLPQKVVDSLSWEVFKQRLNNHRNWSVSQSRQTTESQNS